MSLGSREWYCLQSSSASRRLVNVQLAKDMVVIFITQIFRETLETGGKHFFLRIDGRQLSQFQVQCRTSERHLAGSFCRTFVPMRSGKVPIFPRIQPLLGYATGLSSERQFVTYIAVPIFSVTKSTSNYNSAAKSTVFHSLLSYS
jgi:hypothetical protein